MMQFIVLGYVPGTNIQIGFDSIFMIFCIASMIYLLNLLRKEKSLVLDRAIQTIQYITI